MEEEQQNNKEYDEAINEILYEAIREVMIEEAQATHKVIDETETGVKGYEDVENFYIEQNIQDILDDAKIERDARNDGLIKPEKGTRKFATVPISAIIDYYNKTGVDIMDAETSKDRWEMQKFRMWIQREHPALMVRDPGKTKFHTLN